LKQDEANGLTTQRAITKYHQPDALTPDAPH